jgi:hypothetical protein
MKACNDQHVWTGRDENNGGQRVWCMRCMVPMDVRRLLQVYVDKHGGQIR